MGGKGSTKTASSGVVYNTMHNLNDKRIKYVGAAFIESTSHVTQEMLDNVADKYGFSKPQLYGHSYRLKQGFNPLFYQNDEGAIITDIIDTRLNILSVYDKKVNKDDKKNKDGKKTACESVPSVFSKLVYKKGTIFTEKIKTNIEGELRKEASQVDAANKITKIKHLQKIDDYYGSDDYRAGMQETANLIALGRKENNTGLKIYVMPLYKMGSECVIEVTRGDTIYHIPKPSFRILPVGKKGIFTPGHSIDLTLYVLVRKVDRTGCSYFITYITFSSGKTEDKGKPEVYTVQLVLRGNTERFKDQAINSMGKTQGLDGVFSSLSMDKHNQNKAEIDKLIGDLISLNMFKTKYIAEKVFAVKTTEDAPQIIAEEAVEEPGQNEPVNMAEEASVQQSSAAPSTNNIVTQQGGRKYYNKGIRITLH